MERYMDMELRTRTVPRRKRARRERRIWIRRRGMAKV